VRNFWLRLSGFADRRHLLGYSLCLCALQLFLLVSPAFSAEQVAVIYPEISSTYKEVFDKILAGIQTQNGFTFHLYPLAKDFKINQLHDNLHTDRVAGVIALGKRGYLAAKKLPGDLPTVYGALPLVPNGISGISLSADPQKLFQRLKILVPDAKRIFVVYSPNSNGWLMPLAEQAARNIGLDLQTFPADNLRDAMHQYRQLLQNIHGRENTIWLPLDQITANDDVVLPMLLREAWDKDLVICSSKPSQVQRGALFSMYPDNFGLGQDLAKLLNRQLTNKIKASVKPLGKLQIAVNLRTAAHLDLSYNPNQQQEFNLTFPSR